MKSDQRAATLSLQIETKLPLFRQFQAVDWNDPLCPVVDGAAFPSRGQAIVLEMFERF
ncbi:hypothetical protein [Azospirillum doebereinerae]